VARVTIATVGGVLGSLAVLGILLSPSPARAEVIDRVLAVINDQIITLSDANAALRLALIPPEVSDDPIRAVMQRLIDRRLMLIEVERYAPPEPPPAAIDEQVAAIRARFKDALEFETVLTRYGMSQEELRRFIRDSLRIDAYLQQRFTAVARPSEEELVRYYRERGAEFTVEGRLRPFDDVREQVRARVEQAQRDVQVRQWLDGLRRRASLVVLYLPGSRQ
jgi:peptidyl-prolyl cis-trans isomerase SurA